MYRNISLVPRSSKINVIWFPRGWTEISVVHFIQCTEPSFYSTDLQVKRFYNPLLISLCHYVFWFFKENFPHMISKGHTSMDIMSMKLSNQEITKKYNIWTSIPFIPDCHVIFYQLSWKDCDKLFSAEGNFFNRAQGAVSLCEYVLNFVCLKLSGLGLDSKQILYNWSHKDWFLLFFPFPKRNCCLILLCFLFLVFSCTTYASFCEFRPCRDFLMLHIIYWCSSRRIWRFEKTLQFKIYQSWRTSNTSSSHQNKINLKQIRSSWEEEKKCLF